MSAQAKDGGPAFPSYCRSHDGMTLRDWFAGQALKGEASRLSHPHRHRELLACDCYDIADAMLAARNRKQEDGE